MPPISSRRSVAPLSPRSLASNGTATKPSRVVYRQAAVAHPSGPPQQLIKRLGLDEIAARKGHGHYKLVLVDLDTHQVINQLPARDKATVRAYFHQWSGAARAAVEEVATDFWAAYHEVAADLLPGARVVGDRFHVQQHVNDALNTVRRAVQRQMGPDDRAWVQARRHLLLRNDEDLDGAEQLDLEILKAYQPEFDVAHTLKEALRTIYATAPDRASAATQLAEWLAAVAGSGIAALVASRGVCGALARADPQLLCAAHDEWAGGRAEQQDQTGETAGLRLSE